jgi:hypothetical protein
MVAKLPVENNTRKIINTYLKGKIKLLFKINPPTPNIKNDECNFKNTIDIFNNIITKIDSNSITP